MILSLAQIDRIITTTQPLTRLGMARAFEEAIARAQAESLTGSDKDLIAALKDSRKGSSRDMASALMRLRPSEVDRIIAALSRTPQPVLSPAEVVPTAADGDPHCSACQWPHDCYHDGCSKNIAAAPGEK